MAATFDAAVHYLLKRGLGVEDLSAGGDDRIASWRTMNADIRQIGLVLATSDVADW